jgi:2-oxoglutarate dehydrogenase E2 component (dihydrolipoamide succinyltransferase)
MAVDIRVPAVGESITEGSVSKWFKKDGEYVRADEPILELETEKATTEVAAPVSGILHITVPEGQTVPIGSIVGQIEEKAAAPLVEKEHDGRPSHAKAEKAPREVPTTATKETKPEPGRSASQPDEPRLSPEVRRLVRERGIDAHHLKGSGPRGRITKEDVLGFVEQLEPSPAPAPEVSAARPKAEVAGLPTPGPRETRQRMSSIRQRIAERLVAAQQTAAMLTTFNEADLSAVIDLRQRYKEDFAKKHGANLGLISFFVKACIDALGSYPVVNAWIDGAEIVYPHYYNIGVAVSTEKGLMVPVLHDAERMNFAVIEKRLAELVVKAREGKIAVEDLQGGTFTITNGGVFGSLLSTPILNPPQSAILGMHAIQKRAVVRDDAVVGRPMMYLALSYDHRLIDGRDAVRFLVRVKECIENPERLMLEI